MSSSYRISTLRKLARDRLMASGDEVVSVAGAATGFGASESTGLKALMR